MRKAAVILGLGLGILVSSCGGGHVCDAYNSSDYTKYKAEQSKKIELNIRKK